MTEHKALFKEGKFNVVDTSNGDGDGVEYRLELDSSDEFMK